VVSFPLLQVERALNTLGLNFAERIAWKKQKYEMQV